jgi:hypothetical protein
MSPWLAGKCRGWDSVPNYCTVLQMCDLQAKYCVDEVHYTSDMASVLQETQPPCLHMLAGTNTDRSAPIFTRPWAS